MRKFVMASALVVFLGLLASQALACWWDGNYGGHMMGWGGSGYYSQDYLNETATLRQELAAKQGEYTALMAQSNPDPKGAAQLSKEIVSLQDQLQVKAQARGFMGPRGYGYGPDGDRWACW